MATASMPFSIPSLNYRAVRVGRVNRKQGVAFATMNKETLGVRVTEGEGSLPKVVLTSAGGSEAELYLFGGCVTSWKASNDKDLLFVRPDAVFNWKKPISGGVPHCFPQFGPGPMQQHGFARNMDWSILDSENVEGNPVITLELKDGPYSRAMWDFSFQALFKASVTGASVKGLKGCKTLNKDPDPKNPVEGKEERCWSDAVLWNPHMQMEACYKDFVCVENAKIGKVQLEPEQSWTAKQHLSIN
ncbi:glucose-6-phosphate 1-epimerase [Citrus sinensis]|uniref:Glucose-6-phosphate 1-epimerase n=1 Tax=Citrus sinensis TaxID=2711 RepID=A0ACB8J1C5_CITSI|nr:glucose-6-phosphate 1-epimerase [Citrus sinensis]